ncbi:MAG: hypothetical protein ACRDIL_13025 [Candidatus Limnocylindrales bacterium]
MVTRQTAAVHVEASDARPAGRLLGGTTAAAIAVVPSLIFHAGEWYFVWLGVPIAALLGAWLAPSIRPSRPFPVGTVTGMSILTVVLGAEATGVAAALPAVDLERIVMGLVFGTYGLVILGLPALVVTVPCAFAWAWLTRWLLGADR